MHPSLVALCDTFLPSIQKPEDPDGYWARRASDLSIPETIVQLISQLKAEDRTQFEQLLGLLSSPLLGLTWLGPLRPFHRLRPEQRETMLRRWANSPLPPLRNAYNALRKLTAMLYFGQADNPNYKTLGYQSLTEHIRPDPISLPILKIKKEATLDCEILVIGSGAGGSIVAALLAKAGHDVLVVDKGGYSPTHEFTQQEFPMLQRHFEAGGLLTSKDGSVTVLAGSTFGGGTTINWAGSLRTPDYVLEEWATEHGNPHFLEKTYQEGFDFVEKRNSVNTDFQHNPQNQALLDAANSLGWKAGAIPLNIRFPENLSAEIAWKATGYSCYGDAYGIKQGAAQTFLHDAATHGARLLPNVDIQRIIVKNGVAVGAEGFCSACPAERSEASGENARLGIPLKINSRKVVVASGALHTPVLLMKSGLTHPHIGRNLWLHPVAPVAAFHEREMLPWQGPMMSVIVQEFARLDGNWGVRLECPPVHPGLAAFALSWQGGESFKSDMANIRHLAVNFALVRDREGGRVTIGKRSGQPIIHYSLSGYDRRHLLHGLEACVRLHAESGAARITVPHNRALHFSPKTERIEDFLQKIRREKWGANWFSLFSAHQMGTCRMGGNRDYPVQPNGETREVRNLFVADGSLFPSASGANPMASIQALAVHVAQYISRSPAL